MLYKDDLFSGNPRNYLGAGKRKNKINLGIMDTVQEQPEKFWAYNNGLTALVNDYEIDNDNITKVHGITIINGTQLTGTIGVVERLKEDFLVPI
ncbi:AIPR family protein [[Clostridium] scindens]|nr:AIPR family protein [[Clostridium] scindens]